MNLELHKSYKARSLYPCVSGIILSVQLFCWGSLQGQVTYRKQISAVLGENSQSRQLTFHSLYNRTMQGCQMFLLLYFVCQYCSTVALQRALDSIGLNTEEDQISGDFTFAKLLFLMRPWMASIHASMPLSCGKI